MFKAIMRYIRAIGYLLTGRVNKAREALEADPNVVAATYDEVIGAKKQQIQDYMTAVAQLITLQERKKAEKQRKEKDLATKEKVMAGAMSKAKARLAALGNDQAAASTDAEFMKWQDAFTTAKGAADKLTGEIAALDEAIKTAQGKIDHHKRGLERLRGEMTELASEKGEAVADIISAKEEKAMNDMLSGLSTDDASEQLEGVRAAVGRAKAEARVSSELAGTDASATEAELLAEAEAASATDDFMSQLMGDAAVESGTKTKPDDGLSDIEREALQ